ncbi:MAG: LuxR C-terminal-related transcriptional regulator [Paludibacter sp.]|nr:LuxR C-terminal-related transcriptional regulator [Paludibacter sp.]
MYHNPSIQLLIRQLVSIVSGLNLTVSTRMAADFKLILQHYITHRSSLAKFSTTLFDLKDQQLVLHNSFFTQYFHSPLLNSAIQNNFERLISFTCPLNIAFCLQTEIIMMNHLRKLTTEQLRNYEVRYIRNLLEKDGLYHSYVIYIQVYKFDEFGRPWILKIETTRTEVTTLPEFHWFSHSTEGYTEEHAYSLHLQKLKFTEKEKTVLELLVKNKTMGTIGRIMKKSPDTIQSYYKTLEQKMNVVSVQEVREIGHILGYC